MKKLLILATTLGIMTGAPLATAAPKDDLRAFRAYFKKKFPSVKLQAYANGIYALDKDRYNAWIEFEDFAPPYEDGVALGKKLFNTPLPNGKTYSSCFPNGGIGIRQNYPYFDKKSGNVVTLEAALAACAKKNGGKLKLKKGNIAALSAYMGYTSRGKPMNVKISNDKRSLAIYTRGKRHFYAKRGQLNFSCADCHVYQAGAMIRGNMLSPAIGHVTHFPVWRKKWAKKGKGATAGFGTLHRRYGGCNKQVRAKPFKAQKDEYTALEYFHSYMSNGIKVNAPGLRQ